ncbi:MAG TPA: molybdenum cofactor biosynthesis protein MoaE [Thermodesulfovibrionales bacterium]|nr:molybdenum cofactor biosynthesis protein MoaE [Thermodesulfovibrionales bacterium]
MVEEWIAEIKKTADYDRLGMILVHNGMVRSTSKDGSAVKGMHLTCDREKLDSLVKEYSQKEGIFAVRAWINEGLLNVGDDIMYLLVAGKFRTYVLPVLEELVGRIKKEVVSEKEFV